MTINIIDMDRKKDVKIFHRTGGQGFWSWENVYWKEARKKTWTGKDTDYEASFHYKDYTNVELNAAYSTDYAEWRNFIIEREKAIKQVNESNKPIEEKKEEVKKFDAKKVDLDKGPYNQILQRVKDIETNIKKLFPRKSKIWKR